MFSDFKSQFLGVERLLAVAIVTMLHLAAVGCGSSALSPVSQSTGSGSEWKREWRWKRQWRRLVEQ